MDDSAEHVVLVDEADGEIGTAPKLDAHRQGRLHRALSVIVRDPQGRILLQKRHAAKYHSGGLWTNTCCSHPRPDEPVAAAATRRLREEMGFGCAAAAADRPSPIVPRSATAWSSTSWCMSSLAAGTRDIGAAGPGARPTATTG